MTQLLPPKSLLEEYGNLLAECLSGKRPGKRTAKEFLKKAMKARTVARGVSIALEAGILSKEEAEELLRVNGYVEVFFENEPAKEAIRSCILRDWVLIDDVLFVPPESSMKEIENVLSALESPYENIRKLYSVKERREHLEGELYILLLEGAIGRKEGKLRAEELKGRKAFIFVQKEDHFQLWRAGKEFELLLWHPGKIVWVYPEGVEALEITLLQLCCAPLIGGTFKVRNGMSRDFKVFGLPDGSYDIIGRLVSPSAIVPEVWLKLTNF